MSLARAAHNLGARWVRSIQAIAFVAFAVFATSARAQDDLPGNKAPAKAASTLNVVVTIPPLKGLVTPLLPEGAAVRSLMPPGRSEHGYEFTPSDLAALAKADVVVLVGLGLEARVEKALKDKAVKGRQVINLGSALGLEQKGEHVHSEECEHDHDHDHGWVDQHVWLDPVLVQTLVPKMKDTIAIAMKSKNASKDQLLALDAKADAWAKKITEVHEQYESRLAPVKGRSFVTHHNAFSRVADRYGITVAASIRQLEASEPTPADIAAAVKAIREGGAKAVFVEPQINQSAPRRIAAAAKVKVGVLDPLGDGDWLALMQKNLDALVAGLSDEAPAAAPVASPDSTPKQGNDPKP